MYDVYLYNAFSQNTELNEFLFQISVNNSKKYCDTVYLPSLHSKFFYCSADEYYNSDIPKAHFPVVHRYYSNGLMLNTDKIGKELQINTSKFTLVHYSKFYPTSLIKEVGFPLKMGLVNFYKFSNLYKHSGGINGETFYINFSLTFRTSRIYHASWKIENNEVVYLRAEELLLPTYPVLYTGDIWKGEEPVKDLTKDDVIKDIFATLSNK